MIPTLLFELIRDVRKPEKGTKDSAGIDFFIPNDFEKQILFPGDRVNIPSGIKARIPKYMALIAFNKSGVAWKMGLSVGACVVDEDYQGEIHLMMVNTSNIAVEIRPGDKIVQFLLVNIPSAWIEFGENIWGTEKTERGEGGFGSTNFKSCSGCGRVLDEENISSDPEQYCSNCITSELD